MKLKQLVAAIAFASASVGSAQAALFTNPSIFTNLNLETFDGISSVVTVPPGFNVNGDLRVTSTSFSDLGPISVANLGENGIWGAFIDPIVPVDGFIASNFQDEDGPTTGSISIRLRNGPVAAIGAWMNAFQATGAAPNSFTIAATDNLGSILESYTVSVDTASDSFNEGKFFGIVRPTADIWRFVITDGVVVVDDVRWAVAPVPEPGEWAMMLAGLGMIGTIAARRRRV